MEEEIIYPDLRIKIYDRFLKNRTAVFDSPFSAFRVTFDPSLVSGDVSDVIGSLEGNYYENLHTIYINEEYNVTAEARLWEFCLSFAQLATWWYGLEFNDTDADYRTAVLAAAKVDDVIDTGARPERLINAIRNKTDEIRLSLMDKIAEYIGCEITRFLMESVGETYEKHVEKPEVEHTHFDEDSKIFKI